MKTSNRILAITEFFLVFPATLFMAALFVRNVQPVQYEPAKTAQGIVDWFSARPHLGLDLGLTALPLFTLVIGGTAVIRSWRSDADLRHRAAEALVAIRAHLATLLILCATLVAGGILGIVGLHMITD